MQNDQDDLRQEQQDLKEHTLNRLDALDEKMEWFLSKGQQGAHPLSERLSQLEGQLYDGTTSIEQQLTPLGSYMEQQQTQLARLETQLTPLGSHMDRQEAQLAWIHNQMEEQQSYLFRLGNKLDEQKSQLTRLGNKLDDQQESTRRVEDVGTLKFS